MGKLKHTLAEDSVVFSGEVSSSESSWWPLFFSMLNLRWLSEGSKERNDFSSISSSVMDSSNFREYSVATEVESKRIWSKKTLSLQSFSRYSISGPCCIFTGPSNKLKNWTLVINGHRIISKIHSLYKQETEKNLKDLKILVQEIWPNCNVLHI